MILRTSLKNLLIRYRGFPTPLKAALWMTVCSFLQKGISVITFPIFTHLLTTQEYGFVSVFISWCNIFILFTGLSLSGGVFNTAMLRYEKQRDYVVSTFLGISTLLTCIAFFIYIPLRIYINKFTGLPTVLMLFLFLDILLAPAYNLRMSQQRFEFQYRPFVLLTLAMSMLIPIVGYICVINSQNRGYARIISMTVVSSVFYFCLFMQIFKRGRGFFDFTIWKYALKINLPLLPHFLSESILNQADRIMIDRIVGKSEAGIYSAGYSAGMILQILVHGIIPAIIPWLYRRIKEGKEKDVREIINSVVFLIAAIAIIFSLLAPECLKILASKEYYSAVYLFPPLTASVYFIFLYNLFVNIELYYEKSAYTTVASCLIAALNIMLNYICINKYGYMAAGYTTLICYIAYACIHYFYMHHLLIKHNHLIPYDMLTLFIISVFVTLLSILSSLLYTMTQIRYSLIGCLFILGFLKRKKLIDFWNVRKH